MNTFVEIVCKDANTNANVKRTINAATINAIDCNANGRAVIIMGGSARFPAGTTTTLQTYEAYPNVVARLAQATPSNPTATVSSGDTSAAAVNQAADAAAGV